MRYLSVHMSACLFIQPRWVTEFVVLWSRGQWIVLAKERIEQWAAIITKCKTRLGKTTILTQFLHQTTKHTNPQFSSSVLYKVGAEFERPSSLLFIRFVGSIRPNWDRLPSDWLTDLFVYRKGLVMRVLTNVRLPRRVSLKWHSSNTLMVLSEFIAVSSTDRDGYELCAETNGFCTRNTNSHRFLHIAKAYPYPCGHSLEDVAEH